MPTLIGEKREADISLRTGKNGILTREQNYNYTVQADSKYQDRLEILRDTIGIPKFGMILAGGMAVKAMDANRNLEDALRWDVKITASSEVDEDQNQDPSSPAGSDPTSWIPIATCTFEPYEYVVRKDFSPPAKRWFNSCNRPFETGLGITRRIAVIPFTQFEPTSTKLDTIMDRCDRTNSATYAGRTANQLLLGVESATIGTYSGLRCWRIDYNVKYRKDTWILEKADVGYGFVDGTGVYRKFFEEQWDTGTYNSSITGVTPFLGNLNLSGGAVTNQRTGAVQFKEFKVYEEINFSSFLRLKFT